METQPTQPTAKPAPSPAPQPVAYDADGRPLYAAPPETHQYVHVSRATSPVKQPISPEIKAKHDESVRRYPHLNLSEGEYVLSAVRRHWIGMLVPAALTVFLVAIVMSAAINYPLIASSFGLDGSGYGAVLLIGTLLSLLFLIGGYVAYWVYTNNRFFLTNESVIQELQQSLFSRHEQTVSLANIEDASYRQEGLIQTILDYGSIRLSTEGDETTYRFPYVTSPKKEIALLNNAVEAFKNGRPIEADRFGADITD